MTDKHRSNHFIIFPLILIFGFDFALALPLLFNSQCLAAHHVNAPTPPNTCYATFNNGLDEFESPDASAIQGAVDAAAPGDIVKVAGTCKGVEARGGMLQTVYISKNLTLEGGHTHNNWSLAPDPDTYTTTLDANQGGRAVVISGTIEVILDSLFITGGHADDGGGIWSNSSMTLKNSIVFSNTAGNGGGISNYANSNPMLTNVTFTENKSNAYGGGKLNFYINPTTMTNVNFFDNKSNIGGGMFNLRSNPTIKILNFLEIQLKLDLLK